MDRDECYGLGWNGIKPSILGPELYRVRLEQLGLILVPNACQPTELIETVLLASKEVRDAFFIYMKSASHGSLKDMLINALGVLPAAPNNHIGLGQMIPHFRHIINHNRPIIDPYLPEEDEDFDQGWNDLREDAVPNPTMAERYNMTLAANCVFLATLNKAVPRQASKVRHGMARSLDDVRADDVWGNYYYLPDDLKLEAGHLVLQALLIDWFGVAFGAIPHTLAQMQPELATHIPHGHNAIVDVFYRVHGRLDLQAHDMGGHDVDTFCTLMHIQNHPSFPVMRDLEPQLFHVEFTRMWKTPAVTRILGNLLAAIWEETSRDLSSSSAAATGDVRRGCDVPGVVLSLCYALTTESHFVMGHPGRRGGQVDADGHTDQHYGRARPTMPDDVLGTSWRIVDAVRVALHELVAVANSPHDDVSAVFDYLRELGSRRQQYWAAQGILWHGVLDWFGLPRLPDPPQTASHYRILADRQPTPSVSEADTDMAEDEAEDDGHDQDGNEYEYGDSSNTSGYRQDPALRSSSPMSSAFASSVGSESSFSTDQDRYTPFGHHHHHHHHPRFPAYDDEDSLSYSAFSTDRTDDSYGHYPIHPADLPAAINLVRAYTQADAEDPTPPSSRAATPIGRGPGMDRNEGYHSSDDDESVDDDERMDDDDDDDDEGLGRPISMMRPLDVIQSYPMHDRLLNTTYNMRPNQLIVSEREAFLRDRLRDDEAAREGLGPYLYVSASGEHDHIMLPARLVDSRRISGNADGIMPRQLVIDTMPANDNDRVYNTDDSDDESNSDGSGNELDVSYADQDLIYTALRSTFPLGPPLREPVSPPPCYTCAGCTNSAGQAVQAVIRSMELQLAGTGIPVPRDASALLDISGDQAVDDEDLMRAVARYGTRRDVDLRLGIVEDNRVPVVGRGRWNRQATNSTRFIWIFHCRNSRVTPTNNDNNNNNNGSPVTIATYSALKPMESRVGHGRESHFWLGVRQEVFRTWRI